MLNLLGLLAALLAVAVLVVAIVKVVYHLTLSVFSIRGETRFIAYLLGPFAFILKDLFDASRQQHVKRTLLWGLVLLASVSLVFIFYPAIAAR